MNKDPIFQLCDVVREVSFSLHKYLRHGHREIIYQRGLAHRLRKRQLKVDEQFETSVFDEDGTCLGTFPADMLANDCLLIELKAVRQFTDDHYAQIIGYLQASTIDHGLLINFGAPRLQIKKLVAPRLADLDQLKEDNEIYQRIYQECN